MFKHGGVCKICGQNIRPNKHKGVITDERLVASKDGWTIEVMVCSLAWNWDELCPKHVVEVITKGYPDSGIVELRNNKMVRLNHSGLDLKEKDFEI
jgi:hypothetical protein